MNKEQLMSEFNKIWDCYTGHNMFTDYLLCDMETVLKEYLNSSVMSKKEVENVKTIKNMTPHDIVVLNANDEVTNIFKSEGVVRVKTQREAFGEVNGVPISKTTLGELDFVPEKVHGTCYIVSSFVKTMFPERKDFLVVGDTKRNEEGQVVGCYGFSL